MNTADDETSSGLNARLRPRKSQVPDSSSQNLLRKPEGKAYQEKPKRTSTPSKAPPNKQDDLVNKSDFLPPPQFLCPYCDKRFASKQTVSKHTQRMHLRVSKQDSVIYCLFCRHSEANSNAIISHMVDNHHDQYFTCLDCHTRFPSSSELSGHKLTGCEKLKSSYRNKLRQNLSPAVKQTKKVHDTDKKDDFLGNRKEYQDGQDFNGIVISCELKPSQEHSEGDIEDNITTNLILPPNKSFGSGAVLEKSAVIVLDDIQWNRRIPSNFSFHNTDADQILSRLGVVHRSPRTGESTRKDWFKIIDDSAQKFERCFDTIFYSKVASNVQENLTKFMDGSFNFNPDPDHTIKTRKSKNSVPINTAEGFPILLACQQYSRNLFEGYMPRAIAPINKHKWKWDSLESDKRPISPNQIKRDAHTNNCIITLVSGLDIWTQLCMRRKFEDKFSSAPLGKKTEKQNVIGKELKDILESREIPTTSSQVVKYKNRPAPSGDGLDFPASLGLSPATTSYDFKPAVLSGEWVRPRCYVCCACGAQTRDSRTLSAHILTEHPNAQVQHYEIVGEPLLNADILKHLYVPPSQMHNRTRPMRGFRDCTKCNKSITLEDLHQHMLDCAGDTPTVRRRQCRYRPFGMRKRRPRLPDNTARKNMRKDLRTRQRRQKSHMRPRQRIRTEVGDAETIRKMLADLPAKRHRVMVNPMNQMSRPRRLLNKQRNKLILKKRIPEGSKTREAYFRRGRSNNVQDEFTSTDAPKEQLSSKDDDDDNKPLKPRVLRVPPSTATRRVQSMKRKVVINRVKRKSIRVKQQNQSTEPADKPVVESLSSSGTEKLSIDNSPNRIDVKSGAYNTREHANSGGSNNREEQRPGCSGTNGNANNFQAPTQNVPLKHSIARLTASSETHDKSVQFHHLFLVQQECNNTNQHLPSGQQILFENEAAVTRLDKPPLNYTHRGHLDLYTFQKNKQNKPRKGLNDCIAMLKNKLSDPAPPNTTGHVSVMCGSDEPIEYEPQISIPDPSNQELEMTYNARPEMIAPSKLPEMRPQELYCDNYLIPHRYTRCEPAPFTSFTPQYDDSFMKHDNIPKQKQSVRGKRKTVQRKSLSEHKPAQNRTIEITPELLLIPQTYTEARSASTPQRSTRARSRRHQQQQSLINPELAFYKRGSHKAYNQKNSTEVVRRVAVPSRLDSIWQNQIEVIPPNRQISYELHPLKSNMMVQKQLEVNTSMSSVIVQKQFQVSPTKNTKTNTGQEHIDIFPPQSNLNEQQPVIYPTRRVSVQSQFQVSPTKNTKNGREQMDIFPPQSHLNEQQQPEIYPTRRVSVQRQFQVSPTKDTKNGQEQVDIFPPHSNLNEQQQPEIYPTRRVSVQRQFQVSPTNNTKNGQEQIDIFPPHSNLNEQQQPEIYPTRRVSVQRQFQVSPTKNTKYGQGQIDIFSPQSNLNEQQQPELYPTRRASVQKQFQVSPTKNTKNGQEQIDIFPPQSDSNEQQQPEIYPTRRVSVNERKPLKIHSNESDIMTQKPAETYDQSYVNNQNQISNISAENIVTPQIQLDIGSENDLTQLPVIMSTENNLIRISSNSRPAHASTLVDSIVMATPLDLSTKVINVDTSNDLTEQQASYEECSYESYETLDLSNKSFDNSRNNTSMINDDDGVVDLSVRHSEYPPSTEDLYIHEVYAEPDIEPTDLSVRGQEDFVTNNWSDQRVEDVNYIQDFSYSYRTNLEPECTGLSRRIEDGNNKYREDFYGNTIQMSRNIVQFSSDDNDNTLKDVTDYVDVSNDYPTDFSVDKGKKNDLPTKSGKLPLQPEPTMNDVISQASQDNFAKRMQSMVHDRFIDMPTSSYAPKFLPYKMNTTTATQTRTTITTQTITSGLSTSADVITVNSNISSAANMIISTESNEYINSNAPVGLTHKSSAENFESLDNTVEGVYPATSLHSRVMTTSDTQFENITLPSVISLAKIEPTCSTVLTNHPLSFSAKPDTKLQIAHAASHVSASVDISGDHCNYKINTNTKVDGEKRKEQSKSSRTDQDTETARKIAMLPKELVEILGNMPLDHRNQLLNILPQYVSTTTATSISDSKTTLTFANAIALSSKTTSSLAIAGKQVTAENNGTTFEPQHNIGTSHVISSARPSIDICQYPPHIAGQFDVKKKPSIQFDATLQPHETLVCVKFNHDNLALNEDPRNSKETIIVNKDKSPVDPFTGIITKVSPQVIDLTNEDNSRNIDVVNVSEDANKLPLQEISTIMAPGKPIRPKTSNDRTASLRAVRIKAPSERQKDSQLLKRTSIEQITTLNKRSRLATECEDIEVNKTSDYNKHSTEQAVISNLQDKTTNVAANCKLPLQIMTTNELEVNPDNMNIKSKPIPIFVDGIVNNESKEGNTDTKSMLLNSSGNDASLNKCSDDNFNIDTNNYNVKNDCNPTVATIPSPYIPTEHLLASKSDTHKNDEDVTAPIPIKSLTSNPIAEINKADIISFVSKDGNDNEKSDDSEDDVSLAVIIKQKNENLQKFVIQNDEYLKKLSRPNKKSLRGKKKKEKKHQKKSCKIISKVRKTPKNYTESVLAKSSFKDVIVEPYKNNNNKEIVKEPETRDSEVAEGIISFKDSGSKVKKHSKKKRKKQLESTKTRNPKNKDFEINKENSVTTDSDKNKNDVHTLDENETGNTIVQDSKMSVPSVVGDKKDKLSEDVLEVTGTKNLRHCVSHLPQTKLYENHPTTVCGDEAEGLSHAIQKETYEIKTTHEIKVFEVEDPQETILLQQDLNKKSNDENSSTTPISLTPTEGQMIKYNIQSAVELENNTESMHMERKDTGNVDTDIPSEQPLSSIEENLKRSKRGKSHFIKSNEVDPKDNLSNEICIDQKPPFTKKQLIFSKLLLDEEVNAETKDFVPVKETLPVVENVNPCITNRDSFDITSPAISVNNSCNETVKVKDKSVKRKKSLQLKRKIKKKKSFDTSNTSTMEIIDNTVKEKNSDVQSIYTSQCAADFNEKIEENEFNDKNVPNPEGDCFKLVTDVDKNPNIASECEITQQLSPNKLSPEKRKIIVTSDIDRSHGSKPKKSKLNQINESSMPEATEVTKVEKDRVNTKQKYEHSGSTEIRPTACYNMPIAARRMRSKSVVVKSDSADLYDPYDIDLDDMIEKTEPMRKKGTVKENKTNNKFKISNTSRTNIFARKSEEVGVAVTKMTCKSNISETPKKKSKKNKMYPMLINDVDICKPTIYIHSTKNKSNKTISAIKSISKKTNRLRTSSYNIKLSNKAKLKDFDRIHKSQISDSDESSKSDVPLNKYVEEKEKRKTILGYNSLEQSSRSGEKLHNDKNKSNRRTLAFSNVDETEEQLRSEQFMESFGFFSERKPRKSNLLAAKKISETFHIIANESDDIYFGTKERTTKRTLQNENQKAADGERQHTHNKKKKRGRKKKICMLPTPSYCNICKKEFFRPDNYIRHQITLLHISKLSEIEMKIKTVPLSEEPNYLVAYRQQMDRLKILKEKIATEKKLKKRSKIKLPSMKQILSEVNKAVREQQLSRGLSTDEELFLDCCELLKESHKNDVPNLHNKNTTAVVNNANNLLCSQPSVSGVDQHKRIGEEKSDSKSDGDVDSITAKNILESEEVRNLENDLISGLQEAANAAANAAANVAANAAASAAVNVAANAAANAGGCNANIDYNRSVDTVTMPSYSQYDRIEDFNVTVESDMGKTKKHSSVVKDKMYPDLETIDMFEDKFDKIKRKCRSQAAAAKQTQAIVEPSASHKGRKKLVKKKGKKSSKKNYQSTVLTKGALKGFDGINVTIPTSEIDITAKAPSTEHTSKKKKKTRSKKKKDKHNAESSIKYVSDNRAKDSSSTQKKVDVYEFMDNEDAELFEFRPSTLMERFKSISSKETQVRDTANVNIVADEIENSSESASDGDDFVYMSDDYVCSDDETENSLMSCEIGNVKLDNKKPCFLKRKDVIEKNAVMGKIFKHNAVRSDKKCTKAKETVRPKANLDQLFDSLLEDEPNISVVNHKYSSEKDEFEYSSSKIDLSPSKYVPLSLKPYDRTLPNLSRSLSPERFNTSLPSTSMKYNCTVTSEVFSPPNKYAPSTSKGYDSLYSIDYGRSTSKMGSKMSIDIYDFNSSKKLGTTSPKKHGTSSPKKYDLEKYGNSSPLRDDSLLFESKDQSTKDNSPLKKVEDLSAELDQSIMLDDSGVARQRVPRKCTVGKQNVLAETWSSESEPDGVLPRPNSAESVVTGAGRKKKGKKKDGQHNGGKRANKHVSIKKQHVESRVNSGNRNPLCSGGGSNDGRLDCGGAEGSKGKGDANPAQLGPVPAAGPSRAGPSEERSEAYYWSEGDEEQEHLQQHGWIVGDSHKKLVTMLAHAKGRKRNNDDKRHLVE